MTTALAPSRSAQTAKTALAVAFTLALVIGLPWALTAYAGAPWTWQLPSLERLQIALSWPPTHTTIGWALLLTCWIVWLCLVITLTKETVLQLAGHRSASQIKGPIRLLAATLTGALAATAPALSANAEVVITAPAEPCPAPETPDATDTATDTAASDGYERNDDGDIVETVGAREGDPSDDTLWGMAEAHYGDGTQYDRIFEANEGIVQSNGRLLTDPNHIVNGTPIVIPGTATVPEPTDHIAPIPPEPQPPEPATEPSSETNEAATDSAAPSATALETQEEATAATPAFSRGTWITAGSFIAISAAAAALALHHRHRSRSRSRSEPTTVQAKDDAAPTESSEATTNAVEDADTEPFTGRLIDLEALLERQRLTEVADGPAFATGTTETNEINVLDHAHEGLGLTGRGAVDVAHATIWSALASGATVTIDTATAERLGLDLANIELPSALQVVPAQDDLLATVRRTQARLQYAPETDTLTQRSTIIVTDHTTAQRLPADLLDDEHTYTIILGPWETAWLDLAADGTPLNGHLTEGPIDDLGQCYLLDRATCNDLIADLATSPATDETDQAQGPEPATEPPPMETEVRTSEQAGPPAADADTSHGKFELTLFGRQQLAWEGEEVHFSRSACIDALAVLALHDGGMSADELSEAITPDASISQAAARRTSTVSAARVTMQALTGTKEQKEQFIIYDRPTNTYQLDRSWIHTDLDAVTEHLAQASAGDDPTERAEHLQAALHHYAGPLAADLDEVWDLMEQRRHWQQTIYRAALDLAALHADAGQHDQCAAILERAIAIDPDNTAAWRLLAAHHRQRGEDTKADEVEARAHRHRTTTRLSRPHDAARR